MSKKLFGLFFGLAAAVFFYFLTPPAGLESPAMMGIGITVCAIIWMMFEVFPMYLSTLTMCTAWVLFGVLPLNLAFGAFSGGIWWLLIGAFGIGAAAGKVGLLRRVALLVMKAAPANFAGQSLALMIVGILGFVIPTSAVKISIMAPLTKGIIKELGYADKSRSADGIFAAMFVGCTCSSVFFLANNVITLAGIAALPAAYKTSYNVASFALAMLVWLVVTYTIFSFLYLRYFKPKNEKPIEKTYILEQLTAIGPMSRDEKICSFILLTVLVLWSTEPFHKMSAPIVSLLALIALCMTGILGPKEFRSDLGWDSLVMVGCVMNMATLVSKTGLDKYIESLIAPVLGPMMGNIYIGILGIFVAVSIIRFVILSLTTLAAVLPIMLAPLAIHAGINPIVIIIVMIVSLNIWILPYQNLAYITAKASLRDTITDKGSAMTNVFYMIASMAGLFASVPLWKIMGYL